MLRQLFGRPGGIILAALAAVAVACVLVMYALLIWFLPTEWGGATQ